VLVGRREEDDLGAARPQIRPDRRTVRRLRVLIAGVAALTVVAAGVSWVAVRQRDRADRAANVAEARRVGAQALVERPYDRALLLAVEAVHLWDSPETRGNLVDTIARSPRAIGVARSSRAIGVARSDSPRLLGLEVSPNSESPRATGWGRPRPFESGAARHRRGAVDAVLLP